MKDFDNSVTSLRLLLFLILGGFMVVVDTTVRLNSRFYSTQRFSVDCRAGYVLPAVPTALC